MAHVVGLGSSVIEIHYPKLKIDKRHTFAEISPPQHANDRTDEDDPFHYGSGQA